MSLKAYKERISPVKNKLYRFALGIVRDPAEAEDIVQEILIKIWRQWEEIHTIQNLEAWSMRLTKNLAIDKLRSRHRRTEDLDRAYQVEVDGPDPYESVVTGDTIGQIRQLMDRLPENQRLVMNLRDIEGLSYQEISEALDMPMPQVKVNLFRARTQIRNHLVKSKTYEA